MRTILARRKLPLLVERTLSDVHALRIQISSEKRATTCTRGCSACCHYPFFISVMEGITLYRYLAKNGKWTPSFKKKVREHRERTMGTAFQIWMLSNIPCSMLEAGECVAYEARPLHCRVVASVGNPKLCHPHTIGPETPQIPRAETLQAFNSAERKLMRRHDLKGVLVPLSEALLAGESVVSGEVPIERVEDQFLLDFARAAHG